MENYFDIIPHATGWIYVLGGRPSASFPSYALALKGARAHAEKERHRLRKPVFRKLELNGKFAAVETTSALPAQTMRP